MCSIVSIWSVQPYWGLTVKPLKLQASCCSKCKRPSVDPNTNLAQHLTLHKPGHKHSLDTLFCDILKCRQTQTSVGCDDFLETICTEKDSPFKHETFSIFQDVGVVQKQQITAGLFYLFMLFLYISSCSASSNVIIK